VFLSKISRTISTSVVSRSKYGFAVVAYFVMCGFSHGSSLNNQTTKAKISFAAVSIREVHGGNPWMTNFTDDGFEGESVPIEYLLRVAFFNYAAPADILNVPDWTRGTYYDIHAKVDPKDIQTFKSMTREQRGLMLQEILENRFACRFHYGKIMHSVYNLTVAKPKPQIISTRVGTEYTGNGTGDAPWKDGAMLRLAGYPDNMEHLARHLSWLPDDDEKMVIDHTGLSGFYKFQLSWCPQNLRSADSGSDCSGPSLFTALKEQLGLELRPATAQLQSVVIDHIAKATSN